jgi:YidC/Oxa1 family membrane protein insertase
VNPLNPLYDAVAWVVSRIYGVLSPVFGASSGWTWALTIVLLVVLMRLIMVPLFIKQMHTTRRMTALAPQMSVLRKKYKNDKQTLNQEMMKLYQEAGVNPLMGCLPVAAQLPMFFALFSVLKAIAEYKTGVPKYHLTTAMVNSAHSAKILGVTIADKFLSSGTPLHIRIVILFAVLVSMATTYLTVRQSMKRGMMPAATPDNPMGQSQKYMAYIMPFFALSGLYWPFGLVLYWVTTNLWTLVQQYVLFRRYPQPLAAGGTAAVTGTVVTPGLAPRRPAPRLPRLPRRLPPSSNGSSESAPAGSGSPDSGNEPGNPAAPARPAAAGGKQQGRTAKPAPQGKTAGPPRSSPQGKPAGAARPSSPGKAAGTAKPSQGKPAGTPSRGKPAGTGRAAANGSSSSNGNGSGGGILRRLGRGRAEPEPEPETPEVKLVRQQRQRQSRSKRSGKG